MSAHRKSSPIQQHTENNKQSTVWQCRNHHVIANELINFIKKSSVTHIFQRHHSELWVDLNLGDYHPRCRFICPPYHQSDMRKDPKHFWEILVLTKLISKCCPFQNASREYIAPLGRGHRLWETKGPIGKECEVSPRQIKITGATERKPSRRGWNSGSERWFLTNV